MHIVAEEKSLVCPRTKQSLRLVGLSEARELVGGGVPLKARAGAGHAPVGETRVVLVREDSTRAYPVVDGIPVLLAPEMLMPDGDRESFDLTDPRYAEAYQEMAFYNGVALDEADQVRGSDSYRRIEPVLGLSPAERLGFPAPRRAWIDAIYDAASQWDAYCGLAPVEGKVLLQVGGKGLHAVKFLLAGAKRAWIVSPMIGEVRLAQALARAVGVDDRLRATVGIAEEFPLAQRSLDGVFAGGCVHHMVTELAFPEIARALRPAGRLVAVEPFRAPFYSAGTSLFGKREVEVFCKPLTHSRLEPFIASFSSAEIIPHGALTRYAMIAGFKLGVRVNLDTAWRVNRLDDAVSDIVPGLRRLGSSVALIGTK